MSEADFCYDIGQELADRDTYYQEHCYRQSNSSDLNTRIYNQRKEIKRLHEEVSRLTKENARLRRDLEKYRK